MTDLSRRNFLKGIAAAAGVAAVGIAMPAAAVIAAPPPPLPFPDIENGDLFFKVNGLWRFVAKVEKISIENRPEIIDVTSFGDPYRRFERGFHDPRLGFGIYCDNPEGAGILEAAHRDYEIMEMAMGMQRHLFQSKILVGELNFSGYFHNSRKRAMVAEFDARPVGEMTITTDKAGYIDHEWPKG